jgi:hypothetical protein
MVDLPKLQVLDPSKKRFRLLEDWKLAYLGKTIIVPEGFETDLASVPALFFWWQWGTWNLPAIVHDWAYLNRSICFLNNDGSFEIIELSRKEADFLFYDLMFDFKVNFIVRRLMHKTVRIFGGKHWKDY